MITMPNQIDFIPVLNIIPQPIYPAIYLPGIVHPFIPYNFVNYPQCGNFSQYNESYDQSLPQSQALPPGLASPEDDIFYFHDFFFSKDDPPLESYRDTISATGSFENTTKIQQQSPELSFLALSIMNSIWNDQQHSDAWEEFSIYKAGSIHQNQWRSLLTEIAQDQTKLIPSDQMSKVINNLLESSSQRSRFQKYCKSKSVHSILENYEEYELWRELESVLKDDQSDLTLNLKSNQGETENSEFVEVQITVSGNDEHEQKLVESQKLKQEQLESSKQILIETKCNNSVLPVELQVEVASANVIVNKEEKDSSKSCFVQDEYIVSTKENNKNDINRSRRNKKNSRKIKSIKSYSNEIESLPSDSDQVNKQQENKEIQDQGSVKLQSYKEFEEDQNITVSSAENIKTVDDEERNPEKVQENIKSKKYKKNRKRKGNKKAAATSLRVEDHSKAIPENNLATASNIPNDSLSAHIEKLLALTLNQENENEFRLATHGNGNKDKLDETPKDEEEKDFVVTKDCHIDMSKDFIKQNHNSTLTGETSAKTETDISTEYEEYKKDGSNHKVSKISKDQKPQFNQIIKVDSEDRQNDIIQSPRSMSNAENEYYMDMISNILSEDPNALERLKEMLLSHSINLGLPAAGFTEEEIQEIEEVNMELEKVMKRRFKDNFAEEDENPLLQQEDKSRRNRPYVQEHDLVGLSNELVSLSALLCDDFDDITLQKNNEIDSNVLGIPFDTISYLEELMRNRAEFMEELQSGTKNA